MADLPVDLISSKEPEGSFFASGDLLDVSGLILMLG